jgi:hypothetical protein
MRAFWAVVIASVVVGVGGVLTLALAVGEYTDTLRTYTRLEVRYEPDSFVWLEPDYSRARATLLLTNNSPANARITDLNLSLYVDGEFAGTAYERPAAFDVARGATIALPVEMQVTSRGIQAQGGSARLSLGGRIVADFSGVERELVLRMRGNVGQVDRVEGR